MLAFCLPKHINRIQPVHLPRSRDLTDSQAHVTNPPICVCLCDFWPRCDERLA